MVTAQCRPAFSIEESFKKNSIQPKSFSSPILLPYASSLIASETSAAMTQANLRTAQQ
jgi:hypothetical protein